MVKHKRKLFNVTRGTTLNYSDYGFSDENYRWDEAYLSKINTIPRIKREANYGYDIYISPQYQSVE